MKKMFTLLALTLIVSMATFAQKPLYGTAATPQKAEKSLKVTMPNAKRVASKPMMAETSKNGTPFKASKAPAAAKAPEVVTPPENADVLYYTLEGNYYIYNGGWVGPQTAERTVKVVFDGNDVYVSGLFHYITDAYVKGSTEDGETVTFPMGQYLGNGGADFYSGAQDDEGKFIDMTATFDAETGVFTFNTIAGTCAVDDSGNLYGLYAYGDEGITLTPAGDDVLVPIEPPSSLTTEEYLFKGNNYFAETGEDPTVSRIVNVGFYGNDVYIQGFSAYLPNAWIKGTLTDGKYVFALGEYLGKYYDAYDLQLAGITSDIIYSDITFIYDATENKFTATTQFLGTIYYYPEAERYYWDELFNGTITITKIVEKAATPVKPTIQNIGFGYFGDYLDFAINMTDTEGNGLIPSKVAYKFWSEDELGSQSEVTLSTADYEKLDADLTEIPYTFSDDYDIYNNNIYLNMQEHYEWVKVGLQTIYNGGGEKHESEITWYEIPWYTYISDKDIPSDMPITANEVSGTKNPDSPEAFTSSVNVGLYGEGKYIFIQGILEGTKMWTMGQKDGDTYKMINGCYLADHAGYYKSLYLIGYNTETGKIEAPVLEIDETNGVYKMKNDWIINADYLDKLFYFEWINNGTTIAINGEDTGISEVRANKAAADNKVYNLAGQQVGKEYKGLIIKNGKKFINK
ncbi:MAG: hypothetical protein II854_01510 [Prevotella sp.]|nr:hypothetical protein [Prevotella sp.]